MNRLRGWIALVKSMGLRYTIYRIWHELMRRSGLLRYQFPISPAFRTFISLEEWQKNAPAFFFHEKNALRFEKQPDAPLRDAAKALLQGRLCFFNATFIDLGTDYDWVTNPSNQFTFDAKVHWTDIEDFSPVSGDIKYVWEKSRFSWIYTLIRDDYHNSQDHGEFLFSEIDSWIKANPVNCGPNWRCSQEISLRTLNWIFALYYYRHHPALREERFERIMHVIYWQLRHVRQHINFSRIAVRNNHALTECMMLYVAGLLFPFIPESAGWKKLGKLWFEQEIGYQVYEDGTFLQFSHNYHRVLVQLLTYALFLSDTHGESLAPVVYERAKKTLDYLFQCQAGKSGELPNYGANDGALFFPLNNAGYTDYRPQINALYYFFSTQHVYANSAVEDAFWWSGNARFSSSDGAFELKKRVISMFPNGGIYLINDSDSFSFLKCTGYKNRPLQADNMHLDLWINGENVLRDSGSYSYNTAPELVRYFSGSKGHNTVMLNDFDQMQKGSRFIWLYWNRNANAGFKEEENAYLFECRVDAFRQAGDGIKLHRRVRKIKGESVWYIDDRIENAPQRSDMALVQYWHPNTKAELNLQFDAVSSQGQKLAAITAEGWYSDHYGVKASNPTIYFSSDTLNIETKISIQEQSNQEESAAL